MRNLSVGELNPKDFSTSICLQIYFHKFEQNISEILYCDSPACFKDRK